EERLELDEQRELVVLAQALLQQVLPDGQALAKRDAHDPDHSERTELHRRSERNARTPSTAIRGSLSRRPARSTTTRSTASGRPPADSASHADSMSTASAPSRLERSAGERMRSAETSGPTCARSPWRRAVAASSSAPETATVVPSSRRSSLAQTTSPGRSA